MDSLDILRKPHAITPPSRMRPGLRAYVECQAKRQGSDTARGRVK